MPAAFYLDRDKTWGYLGAELTASWNYLSFDSGEGKTSLHAAGAEVNALFQKWLPSRTMALTFRAGAGLAGAKDKLFPRVQAGAAFLWFFYEPFFVEAGIDFVHWFVKETPQPGFIRPWLGINYKL